VTGEKMSSTKVSSTKVSSTKVSSPGENTLPLLESVLDSMNEGFIAWSEDYKLVAWNQLFLDYWDYPTDLMKVGLPLVDALEYQVSKGTYGAPGDNPRQIAEDRMASVMADFDQSTTPDGYETIVKSPSGHWLHMRRKLVDGFGFLTWAIDVTEKIVAERAAELMHDNINSFSDSIIMSDTDGRILFTNDRYHEIYPYSPAKDEIIGCTMEQLIRTTLESGMVEHPLAASDPEAWVQERLAERQLKGTRELESRRKDGRIYLIKQDQDEKTGSIIITSDITDRIKAKEALQEAKDNLEDRVEERTRELQEEIIQREIASRAKSEFLANMSHELRTPLNAIIGFSEVMLREVKGPLGNASYLEYAKAINDAGDHLLDLINDVLDLSKVEAGQWELYEEEIDLQRLVDWAGRMVSEQAARRQLVVVSHISGSDDVSDIVYADERALRQILLNLFSNAVKFTDPGGRIEISRETDAEDYLIISITDDGIGIADEDLERVMEQFSQAAPTDTRDHEGTGLGLPLVRKLVELHNGKFVLTSKLGVGTKVSVCLPPERRVRQGGVSPGGTPDRP
jgi:PAS domain S-box-containing protein